MDVLKQNTNNHFASAEFCAVLLPESSEPMILVANGVIYFIFLIKKNNFLRAQILAY